MGTTPREPETEAGRELMSLMGWSNLNLRGEVLRLVLDIEAQLRAKLAAEVGKIHFGPGYAITLDDQGWDSALDAVLRLLRADGGAA